MFISWVQCLWGGLWAIDDEKASGISSSSVWQLLICGVRNSTRNLVRWARLLSVFQSYWNEGWEQVLRVFCHGLLGEDLKCLCFGCHKASILGELIITAPWTTGHSQRATCKTMQWRAVSGSSPSHPLPLCTAWTCGLWLMMLSEALKAQACP